MNDESALRELLSMSRIYRRRGQVDKSEECLLLARLIEQRINEQNLKTQNLKTVKAKATEAEAA